jgi:pilus assembly protein FimV
MLEIDEDLLTATGVTQVLSSTGVDIGDHDDDEDDEDHEDLEQAKTSVLDDEDATLLAPSFDDGTLTGTEVLDGRFQVDRSGDTSLVKALGDDDGLDLNLDDLSAALHGGDTVEQPRSSPWSDDVFGGGSETPLDLDIGAEGLEDDDPTGTEEVSPLDPHTMTEVGTKLDLARAYIDMGDPEGARSILEEVLDEGDPSQRREAQGLIDVLSAELASRQHIPARPLSWARRPTFTRGSSPPELCTHAYAANRPGSRIRRHRVRRLADPANRPQHRGRACDSRLARGR